MVIVGDRFEQGLAGGICQVSSTLYNACLLAGLQITERHNHNLAVAYVPLGQDATVTYGSQDFRFKNNLGDPIYIWTQAINGKLSMKIYGNLKHKQKIQISHIVDQVIDFKEIRETKQDLAAGTSKVEQNGSPGYVVRSFRTFYNGDGSVARQEQLARDYYRPLNRLIYVGPETSPPQSDKTEPEEPEPVNEPPAPEVVVE
jgi:vancomycin resistance protein YoaR